MLRDKGYATGAVGKWHLGVEEFGPWSQGFDEYQGILSTQNECTSNLRTPGSAIPGHTPFGPCPYYENRTIVEQGALDVANIDMRTDAFAADFIHRHAATGRPFFFYHASHHTHAPREESDALHCIAFRPGSLQAPPTPLTPSPPVPSIHPPQNSPAPNSTARLKEVCTAILSRNLTGQPASSDRQSKTPASRMRP